MMPTPPAAVVFDAVGTLLSPEPAFDVVYADVGHSLGSRHSREVILRRFAVAFARQEQIDEVSGWTTSEEREVRRWRDIVFEVLDDVTDREAAFAALYAH